jgi:hypothetical protein
MARDACLMSDDEGKPPQSSALVNPAVPITSAADPFHIIKEGLQAAKAGKPLSANPHDPAGSQGLRWRAGWFIGSHTVHD